MNTRSSSLFLLAVSALTLSSEAVFIFNRTDSNLTTLENPDIQNLSFNVTETDGPNTGDGFSVDISGDSIFDLNVTGDETLGRARFTVIVDRDTTDLSFVTFVVNYDNLVGPLNPTGPANGDFSEPLLFLREQSDNDIVADLGLNTQGVAIDNPAMVNMTDGGNGQITVTPDIFGDPANQDRIAFISSLRNQETTPGLAGFTITVRPATGEFFEPRTRFLLTLDGFISDVPVVAIPEPSAMICALIGGMLGLTRRRR